MYVYMYTYGALPTPEFVNFNAPMEGVGSASSYSGLGFRV